MKPGQPSHFQLDLNKIGHDSVVVMDAAENIYPVFVVVTTCHCPKLEVLLLKLQLGPKIVPDAVDPYVLNQMDVIVAHTLPDLQTRVLPAKQQQIFLSKGHQFMPRSTFRHIGGNESFHLDLASLVAGRRADCDFIEIIKVLFLVVHIAVGATEEIKRGTVVCNGGV